MFRVNRTQPAGFTFLIASKTRRRVNKNAPYSRNAPPDMKTAAAKEEKLSPEEIAARKNKREAYLLMQKSYKQKRREIRRKLFYASLKVFLYRFLVFSIIFLFMMII